MKRHVMCKQYMVCIIYFQTFMDKILSGNGLDENVFIHILKTRFLNVWEVYACTGGCFVNG